jgi:agmatinase
MIAVNGFSGFPQSLPDGTRPRVTIFGAGHGSTYPDGDSSNHAQAPNIIRAASQIDTPLLHHWDFDLGGPLFGTEIGCCIDAGDLPTRMLDNAGNRTQIQSMTQQILAAGPSPSS